MKKIVLIILTLVMICGNISVSAEDEYYLPLDEFDFGEPSVRDVLTWIPVNYKDYLTSDNMAQTLHELFIPFDAGEVSGNECINILHKYGLDNRSKVFRLDEIQQTFNVAYDTNIDMKSLDGLTLEGNKFINIYDNYFVVTLSPHGTNVEPWAINAIALRDGREYWTWYDYTEWENSGDRKMVYTLTSVKSACQYNFLAIDYIGYEPPSYEILNNHQRPISVIVNGKFVDFDQQPVIYDDRTLVPVRAIFEALGATVVWDDSLQMVTATKDGIKIKITVGSNILYKNNEIYTLDTPAMIVNDRLLVPVRAVSEAFGCDVRWDEENKTVNIADNIKYISENILTDFLQNSFETEFIKMQSNALFDIDNDEEYITAKQKINLYSFIDLDNDGVNELIISSTPIDTDELIGDCISVWDCGDKGDVVCALAKCGQRSRTTYRYNIIEYSGEIYLLESNGESNSNGRTGIRNLYKYDGNGYCFAAKDKIYYSMSYDASNNSDEFIVNNENKTRNYVENYVDAIDQSKVLYQLFSN